MDLTVFFVIFINIIVFSLTPSILSATVNNTAGYFLSGEEREILYIHYWDNYGGLIVQLWDQLYTGISFPYRTVYVMLYILQQLEPQQFYRDKVTRLQEGWQRFGCPGLCTSTRLLFLSLLLYAYRSVYQLRGQQAGYVPSKNSL